MRLASKIVCAVSCVFAGFLSTAHASSFDIDSDGAVNAADVQLVINAALSIDIGELDADVDDSSAVDALDIQLVINVVLGRFVNRPPVFSPLSDRTAVERSELRFTVAASDPDTGAVRLAALDLPGSAAFDAESGAFAWTPGIGAAEMPPYVATYSASDGELTTVVSVRITVVTPQPPTVEFSRSSGTFSENFFLELRSSIPGAEIRYTQDGSLPDESSSLYGGSIRFNVTSVVRARAFLAVEGPGPIASQNYIRLAPDLLDFDSNLPVAVIETFGQHLNELPPRPYLPVAALFVDVDVSTNRAALAGTAHYAGRAGMHIRGSSSLAFPKKQFAFELWDADDQDTDFPLLGLPSESDWVLHAPYSDQTLMRNHLAYMWSNRIGRYAPRTRFFELFLSVDGEQVTAADYHGVYVLTEKIKRDNNRIDVDRLEVTDIAEPEVTGGYIFKNDLLDPGDSGFQTSIGLRLAYVEPKEEEIATEQAAYLKGYLDDFEAALYGSNFRDPSVGYQKYIDADSFVDHHILVEMMKNTDGFRRSTYWHKDRGRRVEMGPIWDYNLALGNRKDWAAGDRPTGWYRSYVDHSQDMYPWWPRLFEDLLFAQRWMDRWALYRQDAFDSQRLLNDIDQTAALLAEAAERNFDRWKTLGTCVWGNGAGCETRLTYQSEVDWMRAWVDTRLAWIDGKQLLAPEFSANSAVFSTSFALRIADPNGAGVIYYALGGADPIALVSGAQSEMVLVAADAPKSVLTPNGNIGNTWTSTGYNDSDGLHGSGGVGDEKAFGYENHFDIAADQAGNFTSMSLHMRYDDGFIAYLNGIEIARAIAPVSPSWDSTATALNDDASAVVFREFNVTAALNELLLGENVLAIHGLDESVSSSDFLIAAELVAREPFSDARAEIYEGPLHVNGPTRIIARAFDGSQWSPPAAATFVNDAFTDDIRISEIMYHPAADREDLEFIEVTNVGSAPVNLEFVRFSEGIRFTFPSTELAPGSFVVVARNHVAFVEEYGPGITVAGEYTGALDNRGERIRLENAIGEGILDFEYRDDWRSVTDGEGFSLTIIDAANPDINAWNDKTGWRPSAQVGGSPGADDSGAVPEPGSVVINEVLAHSHGGSPDWIELHNTTESTIAIGGWFLSDNESDLTKYEIPQGVSIAPNGYIVFWEDDHFGLNSTDAGVRTPFALSEHGETVYLRSGSGGSITGYAEQEEFGASRTDVAFGRYEKSTGTLNFVAMSTNTPGRPNVYPEVGPIVFTEIMYSPASDNQAEEYIELLNVTGSAVDLADVNGNPWKFTSGIDYAFPQGITVPAGGRLLVLKDVAAFIAAHSRVPGGVQVLGPYTGKLNNGGEKIELAAPGDLDALGVRHYIRIDRLVYDDEPPWPISADGGGYTLTREVPNGYGNDVANWAAASPTPGR
jgi:hypothetical protein